ncbi:S16 family serine protease [Micromonospora chalcea]
MSSDSPPKDRPANVVPSGAIAELSRLGDPDRAGHDDLLHATTGRRHLVWAACVEGVAVDPEWLAGPATELFERAIDEMPDAPAGRQLKGPTEALVAAARVVSGAYSHTLNNDLNAVMRRWEGSRVLLRTMLSTELPGAALGGGGDAVLRALGELSTYAASPARTMAGLVVILLRRPDSMVEPFATHVLLDANAGGTKVTGAAAMLELEELPGGPPGLFPDPRVMSLIRADDRFQKGIEDAWAATTRALDKPPCVLWRMRTDDGGPIQPVSYIEGTSAGAAFGVLLSALVRRQLRATSLRERVTRRRRLRGRVALTGVVTPEGKVLQIEGVDAKLIAAAERQLRPILPQGNKKDAKAKLVEKLEPEWASTIDEALRRATEYSPRQRRAALAALAAILLVAVTGTVFFVTGQSAQDRAARQAASANLITAAQNRRDQDPIQAALLAAQAYAQAPDRTGHADAALELLRQLTYNGQFGGEITGNTHRINATAVARLPSGDVLLGGTGDGRLFAARVAERKVSMREGSAHDGAINQIAVNPVVPDSFATVGADSKLALWRLEGGSLVSGPDAGLGEHDPGEVWTVAYSPDGRVIAAGDNQGWITLVDAATGKALAEVRPHRTLPIAGAAIGAVAFGPPGSDALYAGTAASRLVKVDYRGLLTTGERTEPKTTLLDTPDRGAINALSLIPEAGWYSSVGSTRAGVLLIGSDAGLEAWNLDSGRQAAAFPVGGVGRAVRTIAVSGRLIAVGELGQTVLLDVSLDTTETLRFSVRDIRAGTAPAAAIAGDRVLTPVASGAVRVWLQDRRPLAETLADVTPLDVGIGSDGTVYALDPEQGLIRVNGDGRRTLPTGIRSGGLVAVSGSGLVAIADMDPKSAAPLRIVNGETLAEAELSDIAHKLAACDGVTAAAFLPAEPTRLAVGCRSGLVQLWDTDTWQVSSTAMLRGLIPSSFAVANRGLLVGGLPGRDGDLNADGIGGLVRLGLPDLIEETAVPANAGGVIGVVVSGDRVVAAGRDGVARAWTSDLSPATNPVTVGDAVHAVSSTLLDGRIVAAVDHELVVLDPNTLGTVASAPVGRPVTRLAVGGARGTMVGRVLPVERRYAVAASFAPTPEQPIALTWHLDADRLVARVCELAGRALTGDELSQYGRRSDVGLRKQCETPTQSTPATSAPSGDGTGPDDVLVTATEPPRPRRGDHDCGSLNADGSACDLVVGGQDDYAWTITPGVATPDGQSASQLVVYRGTEDGQSWVPVLRTRDGWTGAEIFVWPVSQRHGERSLAVGHRATSRGGFITLALVTEGRVEKTISTVRRVERGENALRVWAGVYTRADSDCCPSNWTTYELRRNASGQWTETGTRAVSVNEIPEW